MFQFFLYILINWIINNNMKGAVYNFIIKYPFPHVLQQVARSSADMFTNICPLDLQILSLIASTPPKAYYYR